MRHVHLLIKPASGLCNLNCRYCFYHDIVEKREQASYGLMTEDTLAAVLEKALAAASHSCTIAFQGGEPTLAGLDFFRKAVELQRRLNVNRVQVYNSIQTNGLLLDSQWAAFFRENHFLVGLSLDGMKDTHDLYRLDAQGQGTFNRAARVLQLLESHGVAYNGGQQGHRPACGKDIPLLPAQPLGVPAIYSLLGPLGRGAGKPGIFPDAGGLRGLFVQAV